MSLHPAGIYHVMSYNTAKITAHSKRFLCMEKNVPQSQ
jgi:hypothetical protein